MKKIFLLTVSFLVVLSFLINVSAQKTDFSGTWKLDSLTKPVTGGFPVLLQITIKIKGDSLLTERVYDIGDGKSYPFIENVTTDGKEYGITVYGMPRKSKATWADNDLTLNLESLTTAYRSEGQFDFKSLEKWTVDKSNNLLTISYRNSSAAGESDGGFILKKDM